MPSLEELVFNSQPLILQSFAEKKRRSWSGDDYDAGWRLQTPDFKTADSVMDPATQQLIQLQALFRALNHARTRTGAAVL